MPSASTADSRPARFVLNPAAIIVVCAIALTILGLTILFSASASYKQGPYYYLNKQLLGVVLAAAVCYITSRLNLDYARRYVWWIGGVTLFLLLLVLIPHIGVWRGGARRWLGFGPLVLQLAE